MGSELWPGTRGTVCFKNSPGDSTLQAGLRATWVQLPKSGQLVHRLGYPRLRLSPLHHGPGRAWGSVWITGYSAFGRLSCPLHSWGPDLRLSGLHRSAQVLPSPLGAPANPLRFGFFLHCALGLCLLCRSLEQHLRETDVHSSPVPGPQQDARVAAPRAGRCWADRASAVSSPLSEPSCCPLSPTGPLGSCSGRSPRWPSSPTRACPTSRSFASLWRAAFWTSRTTVPTCCMSSLGPRHTPSMFPDP